MQSHTQSNRPQPSSKKPALTSAFSEAFLGKLRFLAREHEEPALVTEEEAVLSGPFTVEEVAGEEGARHAVVQHDEPVVAGGRAAAIHRKREEALRFAAVLPAVMAPPLHHVSNEPKPRGCYTLHCGRRFVAHLPSGVGRLSPEQRRKLARHLDLVRYLAANPRALALVLESAGPEALPVLGRALARRIEAALP